MRVNKNGLADLKRLKKQAGSAETPTAAAQPKPVGRRQTALPAKPAAADAVLDTDDATLFRRAVKAVQPIKKSRRVVLPPVPAAPPVQLRQRRESATGQAPARLSPVSDHYTPAGHHRDDSRYIKPGHGPDLIKGLQRGKWPVGASLDLHGATLDEARDRLDRFLQSCVAHQIKCIRIVHGKGHGSKDGESVLKQNVRRWLTQIALVLAYSECSEQDGGAGAVLVLLRLGDPA